MADEHSEYEDGDEDLMRGEEYGSGDDDSNDGSQGVWEGSDAEEDHYAEEDEEVEEYDEAECPDDDEQEEVLEQDEVHKKKVGTYRQSKQPQRQSHGEDNNEDNDSLQDDGQRDEDLDDRVEASTSKKKQTRVRTVSFTAGTKKQATNGNQYNGANDEARQEYDDDDDDGYFKDGAAKSAVDFDGDAMNSEEEEEAYGARHQGDRRYTELRSLEEDDCSEQDPEPVSSTKNLARAVDTKGSTPNSKTSSHPAKHAPPLASKRVGGINPAASTGGEIAPSTPLLGGNNDRKKGGGGGPLPSSAKRSLPPTEAKPMSTSSGATDHDGGGDGGVSRKKPRDDDGVARERVGKNQKDKNPSVPLGKAPRPSQQLKKQSQRASSQPAQDAVDEQDNGAADGCKMLQHYGRGYYSIPKATKEASNGWVVFPSEPVLVDSATTLGVLKQSSVHTLSARKKYTSAWNNLDIPLGAVGIHRGFCNPEPTNGEDGLPAVSTAYNWGCFLTLRDGDSKLDRTELVPLPCDVYNKILHRVERATSAGEKVPSGLASPVYRATKDNKKRVNPTKDPNVEREKNPGKSNAITPPSSRKSKQRTPEADHNDDSAVGGDGDGGTGEDEEDLGNGSTTLAAEAPKSTSGSSASGAGGKPRGGNTKSMDASSSLPSQSRKKLKTASVGDAGVDADEPVGGSKRRMETASNVNDTGAPLVSSTPMVIFHGGTVELPLRLAHASPSIWNSTLIGPVNKQLLNVVSHAARTCGGTKTACLKITVEVPMTYSR